MSLYISLTLVSLRWRLHFEFVTAREPVELPTVLQNQSEVTVWTGAEQVDVDTFSWDLPIKVLPTNPALASYVSQFTGTNSINIWIDQECARVCVFVCACVIFLYLDLQIKTRRIMFLVFYLSYLVCVCGPDFNISSINMGPLPYLLCFCLVH